MGGSQQRSAAPPAAPPPSSLSASQDLDLDPDQVPPSSNLDDSLARRKQATIKSITRTGSVADFPVVLTEGSGGGFQWAVGETQGRRKTMEDAHVVNLDIDGQGTALFAVFDGHSGREVSAFCAQHIAEEVVRSDAFRRSDLPGALGAAFLALDRRMRDEDSRTELQEYAEGHPVSSTKTYGITDEHGHYQGPKAGSTAAVALVRGEQLAVAHAGDSRVVLSEGGVAVALTEDHKPDLPAERDRIYRAGHFVLQRPGGVPRVGGSLAMSRAMGDVRFKDPGLAPDQQAVTAAPDTAAVRLGTSGGASLMPELYPAGAGEEDKESGAGAGGGGAGGAGGGGGGPSPSSSPSCLPHPPLLVVACDGLWDVMNRQMVINFLELHLARNGGSLRSAVSNLLHEALRHDSTTAPTADNVTVLLVRLPENNNNKKNNNNEKDKHGEVTAAGAAAK